MVPGNHNSRIYKSFQGISFYGSLYYPLSLHGLPVYMGEVRNRAVFFPRTKSGRGVYGSANRGKPAEIVDNRLCSKMKSDHVKMLKLSFMSHKNIKTPAEFH